MSREGAGVYLLRRSSATGPPYPHSDINGDTALGNIDAKTGTHQFQLQVRLEF